MGLIAPGEGEIHRFVLELKGKKNLPQQQYEAYKAAIAEVVKRYGAEIADKEYVVVKKKPKRKGGK